MDSAETLLFLMLEEKKRHLASEHISTMATISDKASDTINTPMASPASIIPADDRLESRTVLGLRANPGAEGSVSVRFWAASSQTALPGVCQSWLAFVS